MIMRLMFYALLAAFIGCGSSLLGQNPAPVAPQSAAVTEDYSGMYSFLRDGEFIQITIEDKGAVSGFISRYGDSPSDKGAFIDQFIKAGKFEGGKLTFTTENVHGVWFGFEGTIERGPGKSPDQEAYFVVRGKLTRSTVGTEKKATSEDRPVEFKSFPRDSTSDQK